MYGKITTTDVILRSDLHERMLRHRFSPNLSNFVPGVLEEIDFALEKEFPEQRSMVLRALLVRRITLVRSMDAGEY